MQGLSVLLKTGVILVRCERNHLPCTIISENETGLLESFSERGNPKATPLITKSLYLRSLLLGGTNAISVILMEMIISIDPSTRKDEHARCESCLASALQHKYLKTRLRLPDQNYRRSGPYRLYWIRHNFSRHHYILVQHV